MEDVTVDQETANTAECEVPNETSNADEISEVKRVYVCKP